MSLSAPTHVGVIIGRFQVPELHPGHKKLFNIVLGRHKRVLVLLGLPAWKGGIKNPLDYRTRELMISNAYPTVTVSYITDRQTNEEWSADVDRAIRSIYPLERVTLYGGRGGFTSQYCGSFPSIETLEDPAFDTQSGTAIRDSTAALPIDSADFRAGVIYSAYSLPTSVAMCVDAAIVRYEPIIGHQVLLVRKPNERNWRFPGGKVEPVDPSLERAVSREAREETGLEVGKPIYIGSEGKIPDWRGEQSGIGITSALFFMPYIYGAATAADDVAEARWFNVSSLKDETFEPCHKGFRLLLVEWLIANHTIVFQHVQGANT